ncbi:MAG: flagellar protein FlgN [Eisenbergiella sp.]
MEEIFVFLTEYTEFLEKMEVTQQEKLDLLLSGDLKKIEQSIMVQQAMDKQLENLEQARMRLFQEHGVEGKTFRELIPLQPEARMERVLPPAGRTGSCFMTGCRRRLTTSGTITKITGFCPLGADKSGIRCRDCGSVSGVYHPDYGGRKNMFSKKI